MTFPTAPVQAAYQRDVMFAVELLDPVTLDIVSNGVRVRTTGLTGKPNVNRSGQFVWLAETSTPLHVLVDPGNLPYESEDRLAPLPPSRLLRIVLRPKPGYSAGSGITSVSGSLYESAPPNTVGVASTDVWLEWRDASGGPNGPWTKAAPPKSRTAASGDFVTLLRFDASRVPELDANSRLRARLGFDRAGAIPPVRTTPEFSLSQGQPHDLAPFAWDAL
jgi:hypothetical protein